MKANGDLLKGLTSEEFEHFSVELLRQEGLEAKLVSSWNRADGGVDIIAAKKLSGGITTKFAVQCKHTAGKVSAEPIRALAGVLDNFQAHQGIIMTTSKFTLPAIDEKSKYFWNISLRDFDNLLRSLRELDLL